MTARNPADDMTPENGEHVEPIRWRSRIKLDDRRSRVLDHLTTELADSDWPNNHHPHWFYAQIALWQRSE
jgi:hypothetical protein